MTILWLELETKIDRRSKLDAVNIAIPRPSLLRQLEVIFLWRKKKDRSHDGIPDAESNEIWTPREKNAIIWPGHQYRRAAASGIYRWIISHITDRARPVRVQLAVRLPPRVWRSICSNCVRCLVAQRRGCWAGRNFQRQLRTKNLTSAHGCGFDTGSDTGGGPRLPAQHRQTRLCPIRIWLLKWNVTLAT